MNRRELFKKAVRVVLLFMAAAVCFAWWFFRESHEAANSGTKYITGGIIENITEIHRVKSGSGLTLVKDASGQWSCASQAKLPVSQPFAEKLAQTAAALPVGRALEGTAGLADEFGFGAPSCELEIQTADGSRICYTVGNYNAEISGYYVALNGNYDRAFVIWSRHVEQFLFEDVDVVPGEDVSKLNAAAVKEVSVSSPAGKYAVLSTEKTGVSLYSANYKWAVAGKFQTAVPAFDNRISAFISTVKGLCAKAERVAYDPLGARQDFYGLNEPNMSIEVRYEADMREKVYQIAFRIQDDGRDVYLSDDGKMVYRLLPEQYESLERYLDGRYLLAQDICNFPAGSLSRLVIATPEKTVSFQVQPGENPTYYMNGKAIGAEVFQTVFQLLCSLKSEGYLPEEALARYETPQGEIRVFFETADGRTAELKLQMLDANFYLAEIEGLRGCLVNRINISQLRNLVNQLE